MLLSEFIHTGVSALSGGAVSLQSYPEEEARSIVALLLEERLGVRRYTHIVEPQYQIADEDLEGLHDDLARLLSGEPVQYVIGVQEFCGRRFNVAKGVLIPRPETELLVTEAVSYLLERKACHESKKLKVLDMCTGSGCIAWSIALEAIDCQVLGVDISDTALEIAKRQFAGEMKADWDYDRKQLRGEMMADRSDTALNHVKRQFAGEMKADGDYDRKQLSGEMMADRSDTAREKASRKADISFRKADVLGDIPREVLNWCEDGLDLIVCNPPYIMEKEKKEMRRNVLDWEPEQALFVEDENPLIFYHAVSSWARQLLATDGVGIVEINEKIGKESATVFSSSGWGDVRILKDLAGKDRFVRFSAAN